MHTGPSPRRPRGRPAWRKAILVTATAAVLVATVVGIRGLSANPVRSVAGDGTATISGSFEPVGCDAGCAKECPPQGCAQGFIQAGARSAFVRFPAGCRNPQREQQVTVTARPARDLGNGAYRATSCA